MPKGDLFFHHGTPRIHKYKITSHHSLFQERRKRQNKSNDETNDNDANNDDDKTYIKRETSQGRTSAMVKLQW